MVRMPMISCLLFCALVYTYAGESMVTAKVLSNGDRIRFDGTYYDYRSASGVEMIKLWVPPAARTVRGIFISGHGGGGGDSREFARDLNMRAFAARYGFGLAGLHNFPGGQVYEKGGPLFFSVLRDFAALDKHPELAHVPFAVFGSSNGGATSYGFINAAPQRAICFVTNVTSRFTPSEPVEEALKVPGVIIVGMYDPFGKGMEGVQRAKDLIHGARKKGARWSLIVEQKGHEDGAAFDVYVKLFEQVITRRYPSDADPSKGPVTLVEIAREDGWLVDQQSWDSGLTTIAPFREYKGTAETAGWVPGKDMAYLYRAAATHDNPLAVAVAEVGKVYNPHVDPRTMFSIGGPVVEPGRSLKIMCDVYEFPDWKKIEFYDGARKIGEARKPSEPSMVIKIDKNRTIYSLTVLGYDSRGTIRTGTPFYFFVRDPTVLLTSDQERNPARFVEKPFAQQATGNKSRTSSAGNDSDAVLIAGGLTGDMETSFSNQGGTPSDFWDRLTLDSAVLTPARNGTQSSSFSVVNMIDVAMTVKAAWSPRGLYLYFRVTDNKFLPVDKDRFYETDAIDALLDSRSSASINDPARKTDFINRGWGLTLSTKQYQVAFSDRDDPEECRLNYPDPWDMVYRFVKLSEARKLYGIVIKFSKLDRRTRVQEWCIPWPQIGNGNVTAIPALGARLGFAPGYNDRDDLQGVKELRWVGRKSHWAYSGESGTTPRSWGDIEIGPVAK
jgi:hypothetical protein